MKLCLTIIFMLFLTACGGTNEDVPADKYATADTGTDNLCIAGIKDDSLNAGDITNGPIKNLPWVDSLIKYYIDHSENEAIRNADEKNLGIAWMMGEAETRDEMYLIACRVGRNGDDRFETYQWIYIDTVSHSIYEYDVAEDALNKWIAN